MFRAIPQLDRGRPRRYRLLAEILAMSLASGKDPAAKAQAAGKTRGWQLKVSVPREEKTDAKDPVDHLLSVLDELGFAPERRCSAGEQQTGLRHCPFLELAEARTTIVCPVHLGLMQGVLQNQDVTVGVDRLAAFAESLPSP